MSAITLTQVTKTYGAVTALRPTDLAIRSGEFMTLLGPSGSGKTTLLNIIAGITSASGGEVRFGDVDVTQLPTKERRLGMVFQNYALMPHMSVFDNVAFPLRIRAVGRAEVKKRVMETLALVSMERFAERKPRELSGGQQQRVSIARCLVYRPAIVLMDEPLGALDKKLRTQLQFEIKRLHRELRFTTLYVTHDQEEALSLSDRICLMHDGGIAQLSSPTDMYHQPESVVAADFIGESNLIDAVVTQSGARTVVRAFANTEILVSPSAIEPGARTTVLVRPECVRILRGDDAAPNRLDGIVSDLLFLGDHVRIAVAIGGESRMMVKQSSAVGSQLPRLGDAVAVGWEPESAVLLA